MDAEVDSQLVEGLQNDVLISMVTLFILVVSSVYLFVKRESTVNRIHPTLEAAMEDFRRVFRRDDASHTTNSGNASHRDGTAEGTRRQYNEDRECPICFAPSSFAVITNCGHLFCCNCIYSYWRHSASLVTPVRCAVCRCVVSVLIPSPRDGERETNADEAQTCDIQLNDYNRRFSGEPRPWLDYIRDLPVLLPFMLRTLVSVNGLVWMFRVRVLICLLGVLMYVLSPLDILPESALGLVGMVDDLFIVFVVLIYCSVLFRQLFADGQMRFGLFDMFG